MGIQRLRDDLDDLTATNPALAERLTDALDGLREHRARHRLAGARCCTAARGRKPAQRDPAQRAAVADRAAPGRADAAPDPPDRTPPARALLASRASAQRRGHLDVRRTIRRNAAWGGVPFLTAWKRRTATGRRSSRCATSPARSAQVSDFFLLLIHSLHEVVDDVRSFAFSSHLIEVSDILESKSPEEAMAEIMSKVGFGSSDYGNSLDDFEHGWMSAITPQTTVIVLGDARSNNLDPRADILRRIAERSKRLVWLNPEGRMAWGWGDSEMPRYATFCTVVRQCATAKQLERAVSDIVASLGSVGPPAGSLRLRGLRLLNQARAAGADHTTSFLPHLKPTTDDRTLITPAATGEPQAPEPCPCALRIRPAGVSRRAGGDRPARHRRRQLPGADADRRRQVAVLPAAVPAARRLRHRGLAPDRADAGPGRGPAARPASTRRC